MGRGGRVRRRGKDLEEAIFQAIWDELQEVGFARLTVAGVARRAGTSKSVLYRRWPSRADMLLAALQYFLPEATSVPDQGSLRDDTIAVVLKLRKRAFEIGRTTMLGVLMVMAEDPRENEAIFQGLLNYLRQIMVDTVFARAIARGEIEPGRLIRRLESLPLDLARMEFLITGELPEDSVVELVDTVFMPAVMARMGKPGRTSG